jgi:hypothetical protein
MISNPLINKQGGGQHEPFNVDGIDVCPGICINRALFLVPQRLRKNLTRGVENDLLHHWLGGLPVCLPVPGSDPAGMVLTMYSGGS